MEALTTDRAALKVVDVLARQTRKIEEGRLKGTWLKFVLDCIDPTGRRLTVDVLRRPQTGSGEDTVMKRGDRFFFFPSGRDPFVCDFNDVQHHVHGGSIRFVDDETDEKASSIDFPALPPADATRTNGATPPAATGAFDFDYADELLDKVVRPLVSKACSSLEEVSDDGKLIARCTLLGAFTALRQHGVDFGLDVVAPPPTTDAVLAENPPPADDDVPF